MDASAACDSARIVSCGLDKSVIVWDVATGTPMKRLRGHAGPVTCVRFNEESSMIISGSRDNSVMCWDVRSKQQDPVQTLDEAKDAISSVRVSDHEILTASFDGHIRRYDIRVGELSADQMPDAVTCASFTSDGQCVLASCADGTIRLLDKDSGELLGEYDGHIANDLCLESSVDNQDTRIISGSGDAKLWIWDLATQQVICKLGNQPDFPIVSVSVHPQKNNCILATGGSKIFMWDENPE
ncbi:WD repeat domain-containing protein 83 isoform X2 [Venturia canescens]|nr:WD repeat domain-containing protein 83 isoform X2 [Venturia canescens]XP_043278031.1 WD repeat domain-containing protein 83 isoform X2 [Venturia canescens]